MDLTQTLVARGGTGALALCRGEVGPVLLHEGLPVVVTWADPDADRIYFFRAFDLSALDEGLGDPDVDAGGPIADALRPLLDVLPDGAYRVQVSDTPDVEPDHVADGVPPSSGRLIDWLGLGRAPADDQLLLGTVPRDLVDPRRVTDLVHRIRQGERPAVVVLAAEGDDLAFVVAGHAAMEAWRRLGMPPLLVRVEVLAPEPLGGPEAATLLEIACTHVSELVVAHHRAVHAPSSHAPSSNATGLATGAR